jgi:hypothetical protein
MSIVAKRPVKKGQAAKTRRTRRAVRYLAQSESGVQHRTLRGPRAFHGQVIEKSRPLARAVMIPTADVWRMRLVKEGASCADKLGGSQTQCASVHDKDIGRPNDGHS